MTKKEEIFNILDEFSICNDETVPFIEVTEFNKISDRIVKLFAIPDVSNSVCDCERVFGSTQKDDGNWYCDICGTKTN